MNILFYTSFKVSPTKGGTERTTISIATGLSRYYGCHCFSIYSQEAETPMESCFEGEMLWRRTDDVLYIKKFIQEKEIDWIINQGAFSLVDLFKEVAKVTSCRVAMVHHFEPGWEEHFFSYRSLFESFKKSKTITGRSKYFIKLLLYPYLRKMYIKELHKSYKNSYDRSDKMILLCKGAVTKYTNYARLNNNRKFEIIPNCLSYNEYLPIDKIGEKKKIVLIVSRLDEPPKRLSLALQI